MRFISVKMQMLRFYIRLYGYAGFCLATVGAMHFLFSGGKEMKKISEKEQKLRSDMKIIALQGKSHTGKSYCLQKLIYKISKRSKFVCVHPRDITKFNELIQNGISTTKNSSMVDFLVYGKIDDKTIGIITYGDNEKSLAKGFDRLMKYNCDLYVCACRTHGETVDFLEKLTANGKLVLHGRWHVNEEKYRDITVNNQVEELESEIKEMLK